jgi:hypothetical protein
MAAPDDDDAAVRARAAHVLPLAIDHATGTVYALLGKERRVHGWADSETWSDFGGRVQPARDTDTEAAAAREFWEETCALVSWGGSAPALRVRYFDPRAALVRSACVFDEYDSLARALRDREFALSMSGAGNVTFVKFIPFDAALPHSFDVVWRELHARFFAQVVRPAQRARQTAPLPAYVDDHDVPAVHGTLLVRSVSPGVDADENPLARAYSCAQNDERAADRELGIRQQQQLTEEQLGELLVEQETEAGGSVTVRAAYDDSALSGSLLSRAHPARNSGVTDGAFLEKKAIAWWPLDVLQTACARPDGVMRHDANHLERLRPTCLARLREVLKTM